MLDKTAKPKYTLRKGHSPLPMSHGIPIRRHQPVQKGRLLLISLVVFFSLVPNMPSEPIDAGNPPAFSDPNILVSVGGQNTYKPDLAVDLYGRLYAAWRDDRDGYSDIFFSMSVDGGYTWSENVMVNTAPQASSGWKDQYNPTIATDGKNVYVAWMDCRNKIDAIGHCSRPYDLYMDWSPVDRIDFTTDDIQINTDGTIPVDSSMMSMTADEYNVYLVWLGVKDGRWDILLDWSSSDNIDFSGHRVRVTSDDPDFQQCEPDVVSDGRNIYVVWEDLRDQEPGVPQRDIYFDWSPIGDINFSSPDLRLGSDLTPGIRRKDPSVTADGKNIYVAWWDDRSTVPEDSADIWLTWSPADVISFVSPDIRVNNFGQYGQTSASIATDGETIYAVWQDNRHPVDSWKDVYFNMAPVADLNFSQPDVKVNDDSEPYNQQRPAFGIYDDGVATHIFVIWDDDRFIGTSDMIMFASSPPHPLYPDLSVNDSDISIFPTEPVLGTPILLNATIHNLGEMGVPNATVTFYEGDPSFNQTIGESAISVFAHNKTHAEIEWAPLLPGDYEIYVVVDPYNVVNESNESNNIARVSIRVVPHQPPTVLDATLNGKDLENVTIYWSLSPDDGMGSESVIGYEIYRSTIYDPNGLGYSVISSLPNGTSEFIDVLSGEGDPNDYFYRVCSVDLGGFISCAKDQVGKFTRPLTSGVNLVSIPLIQSDEGVETVLQTLNFDKAWRYDSNMANWKSYATSKPYRGDLISINHTIGIWVNVTNECNLTVAGLVPSSTPIKLRPGWNLVGFPSFNSSYIVADLKAKTLAKTVEGFDSSNSPYFLRLSASTDKLQPGFGYWVRVEFETSWIVNNL